MVCDCNLTEGWKPQEVSIFLQGFVLSLSNPFILTLALHYPHFLTEYTVLSAMFPFLSPVFVSFPLVALFLIWFDRHSVPGLSYEDMFERPNRGSVSSLGGFCSLRVETNGLHPQCLRRMPKKKNHYNNWLDKISKWCRLLFLYLVLTFLAKSSNNPASESMGIIFKVLKPYYMKLHEIICKNDTTICNYKFYSTLFPCISV